MEAKEIKLKTAKGLDYWIKVITEEFSSNLKIAIKQVKISNNQAEFKKNFGIDFCNVEAFGDVDVSSAFVKEYVPFYNYHPFGDVDKWVMSSKCYAFKDHNYKVHTQHYDSLSSWNCILQCLNNPKYVLIYTKEAEL